MNGIDDNFEPGDTEARESSRNATRRKLRGLANVSMVVSILTLAASIIDPSAWCLAAAIAGVLLYLVFSHLSDRTADRTDVGKA
ncbi:MAG: hypothetical protein Q8R33_22685 [Burkholderiales bacterium]|nr:hypothetical protein [Burkholderiales bacterium]